MSSGDGGVSLAEWSTRCLGAETVFTWLFVVSVLSEPLQYEYETILSVLFAMLASKAHHEAEIVYFKIFSRQGLGLDSRIG